MRHLKSLGLIFVLGCSFEFFDNNDGQIIKDGHFQLYSSPQWDNHFANSNRYRRIVLAATNDVMGQILPNEEKTTYTKTGRELSYPVGGAAVLARYLEILREKFPGQTLVLDAGNIHHGTLLSNFTQGESMAKVYNELKYDALTIGPLDFEFGPLDPTKNIAALDDDPQGQLKKNISLHKTPFLISNIVELKSTQLIRWKNIFPYIIKEINGVKVAIIGGVSSHLWKSIRQENIRGLYIRELSNSLVKYSHMAKEEGAQIIVALLHAGGRCGQQFMNKYHLDQYQVNFNPQGKNFCDPKHEVFQIIDNIPVGTIHAVISGHTQSKIANFYRNIPIIQSFSKGQFLGRMELIYDLMKKRIDLEKVRIYQPTKLCHKFFENTQDCYGNDPSLKVGKLTPATFLGELIYPLPRVAHMLEDIREKVRKKSQQKIIKLDHALRKRLLGPSTLSSIITYSIRKATGAQVGFTTNSRPTRLNQNRDGLTYRELYELFPREGHLSKVSLSGQELRRLVEIATSGHDPQIGQFSGIKIVLHKGILEERDLNHDGKKEVWERNRLKSIKLSDGTKIEDEKTYTLGTEVFFSEESAGNYNFIFSNIPESKKKTFPEKTNHQALLDLLRDFSRNEEILNKILENELNWLITI